MQLKYITEPKEQYLSHQKTEGMKYTRTTIHCPLCKGPFPKRQFEDHVYQYHGSKVDECFAMLFGLPFPYRCSCGKDLHYSRIYKGFPTTCGNCATGTLSRAEYKSPEDAHAHKEQLKELLAFAEAEEKRLKKEAELSRIPLEQLPFPSRKDPRFLQRLSQKIRLHAVNCEKEELFAIANLIDKMLKGDAQ
jgi:hypothetical protein